MKKIIAFAGSNSSQSINKSLVTYATEQFEDCLVEILDLNNYEMPIFSIDRERNIGSPPQVQQFLDKMKSADFLLVSMAEHNKSYSTAFKNILDWVSRVEGKLFFGKPMLLLSTSTGAYAGGNVMETALKFFPKFGADIKAHFSLPSFPETFQIGTGIINPTYKEAFDTAIQTMKESTNS